MANDFSSDPSVKALWRFENGALATDSKGTNTLTASASPPTVDTSDFKEGAGCAVFDAANTQHYSITDANLDAGFPFKNGDTVKEGSFCFWYKPTTTGNWRFLISKSNYPPANAAFALIDNNGILYIEYGQGGGTWNDTSTGIALTAGHWYHISCTIDVFGIVLIIVWDYTTSTTYSWVNIFGVAPYITDNDFYIGDRMGLIGTALDGRLDEIVVFNRVINITEIVAIQIGQFSGSWTPYGTNNYSGDSRFKARWRFESGALTVDSIGTNTLSLNSGAYGPSSCATGVQEGGGSVMTADGYLYIADADLNSGFPLKNGDAIQKITVCDWILRDSGGGSARQIWSKGTDIGLGYDDQYGSNLLLGPFRAYLNYKNVKYDLGFNLPGYSVHIAVAVDGVNKTAHIRYYDPVSGAVTNKNLSFAATLGTNTSPFMIGDTVTSWVGEIDEVVVAAEILSDAKIDAIRAGTYIFAQTRNLTTACAVVSAVSAPLLAVVRPLTSSLMAVSAVSTPNLAIQRALATLAAVMSETSGIDLLFNVILNLTTTCAAQSQTSSPVLSVARPLNSVMGAQAQASAITLAVLRDMATSIVAQVATSDIVLRTSLYLDLVTICTALTHTSDIDLILTAYESLLAKAKRFYGPISAADLEAAALQWIVAEEDKEANQ